MNTSAILFLRSTAVGIEHVAHMIATSDGSSNDKHNIHGYKRFGTKGAKLALSVAAVALLPLQWFLSQLLADDRFLLQAQLLQTGILERCSKVSSLPDCFWRRLSEVGVGDDHMSPWELRHIVLSCMRKGVAYLGSEAYEPLGRYPLYLMQGDVEANFVHLDALTDSTQLDFQTQDILLCWRVDPGRLRTIEAITLLKHAPCSTGLCEKGHAPTRLSSRRHTQIQIDMLRLRHMCIFMPLSTGLGGKTRSCSVWSTSMISWWSRASAIAPSLPK